MRKMLDEDDFAKEIWQPLWKNQRPLPLPAYENDCIYRFSKQMNFPRKNISTILDFNNRKMLRIRYKIGHQNDRDVYNYFFFGPLVFNDDGLALRVEKDDGQVEILDSKKFIKKIRRAIGDSMFQS